jgi:uncharacterized protein (DUF1810 family)
MNLDRFVTTQNDTYAAALSELGAGLSANAPEKLAILLQIG